MNISNLVPRALFPGFVVGQSQGKAPWRRGCDFLLVKFISDWILLLHLKQFDGIYSCIITRNISINYTPTENISINYTRLIKFSGTTKILKTSNSEDICTLSCGYIIENISIKQAYPTRLIQVSGIKTKLSILRNSVVAPLRISLVL